MKPNTVVAVVLKSMNGAVDSETVQNPVIRHVFEILNAFFFVFYMRCFLYTASFGVFLLLL